jgi:hypothetical protein
MWTSTGTPPMPMPILQLGIHSQTDVITIEAKIAEKHTTLMDKPSSHCKAYKVEKDGFNFCSQTFFQHFLKKKLNAHCLVIFSFFVCLTHIHWKLSANNELKK